LSLSGLQIVNYILPLVTLPYLIRVLGPEKFGLIAFSQAVIQYFVFTTEYGFNLSATRGVSINRDNKEKISEIFSSVMLIKFALMIFCFLILCLMVFIIDKFNVEWLLYILTFGMVVGNVLFPVWFFQGMERMREVAILHILSKTIFTISIFIFIRIQADYIYVPLINSAGFIFTGILSLWLIFRQFGIKIKFYSFQNIRNEILAGWHVFVSQISVTLFTNTNIFILGLFHSMTIVGYFSIAEKIARAVINLSIPLSTTIYPRTAVLFQESTEAALAFLKKILIFGGGLLGGLSIILFVAAEPLTWLIAGTRIPEVAILIRIMAILPLTIFVDNIYGTQILLNVGKEREFMQAVLYSGIAALILAMVFVPNWGAPASASVFLLSELLVLIFMVNAARKSGIRLFSRVA